MLQDQIHYNDSVKPNSHEIGLLKETLPHFFDVDGNFLMTKFQEMLSEDEVDISKESYGLQFLGRSYATYLAGLKTTTVLSPHTEHNEDPTNKDSENLYLVGDNLDGLKHLVGSYNNAIDCIYIDPPYNTGQDGFVYEDDFGFTTEDLVQKVGLEREEAQRIIDLQGKSTHSAWLTMMLPRLTVAQELLSDEGVIFISIDDNEQANLKLLCDDIFGEQNAVGHVVVAKGTTTGQDANHVGSSIDHLLVYAKNKSQFVLGKLPLDEDDQRRFNREDHRGRYSLLQFRKTGNEDRREDRETMYYPVKSPEGKDVYPIGPSGYESRWRAEEETYKEWEADDMVVWDHNREGRLVPYIKYYLEGRTKSVSNFWDDIPWENAVWNDIEGNKKASNTVKDLFGAKVFSNPKPVELVQRAIQIATNQDSIILDFFSGSATTAHAVLRQNAQDGGNRKFILIQRPEKVKAGTVAANAGYKTIDQIGRQRISLAADELRASANTDIDGGFKLFFVEEPSLTALDGIEQFDPNTPTLFGSDMVDKFATRNSTGISTILATWMMRDGHKIGKNASTITLSTYKLLICDGSAYAIDEGMTSEDVRELVRLIENNQVFISRLVYFPYSLKFHVVQELENNLQNMRSENVVKRIARY